MNDNSKVDNTNLIGLLTNWSDISKKGNFTNLEGYWSLLLIKSIIHKWSIVRSEYCYIEKLVDYINENEVFFHEDIPKFDFFCNTNVESVYKDTNDNIIGVSCGVDDYPCFLKINSLMLYEVRHQNIICCIFKTIISKYSYIYLDFVDFGRHYSMDAIKLVSNLFTSLSEVTMVACSMGESNDMLKYLLKIPKLDTLILVNTVDFSFDSNFTAFIWHLYRSKIKLKSIVLIGFTHIFDILPYLTALQLCSENDLLICKRRDEYLGFHTDIVESFFYTTNYSNKHLEDKGLYKFIPRNGYLYFRKYVKEYCFDYMEKFQFHSTCSNEFGDYLYQRIKGYYSEVTVENTRIIDERLMDQYISWIFLENRFNDPITQIGDRKCIYFHNENTETDLKRSEL
jgi:hypothetical protein